MEDRDDLFPAWKKATATHRTVAREWLGRVKESAQLVPLQKLLLARGWPATWVVDNFMEIHGLEELPENALRQERTHFNTDEVTDCDVNPRVRELLPGDGYEPGERRTTPLRFNDCNRDPYLVYGWRAKLGAVRWDVLLDVYLYVCGKDEDSTMFPRAARNTYHDEGMLVTKLVQDYKVLPGKERIAEELKLEHERRAKALLKKKNDLLEDQEDEE